MNNNNFQNSYQEKRSLWILDTVGLCPLTRKEFVQKLFTIPREPISATVNLVGIPAVVSSIENPEYAKMYNGSTMSVIDGMPFVKKAKRKGFACERCSGPDIMGMVFEESIKNGSKHFFYGGKNDSVLIKMVNNLNASYPGLNIVGTYSPPFRQLTKEEDKEIVRLINSLSPDFVWVGIGAPKQELWMQNHRDRIHGTCMLGVGAAFDFIAGTLSKAPKWMEDAGIEWLFRLYKEPRRLWKRYILGGIKYLKYCIKHAFIKKTES